jgi:hypothetical protein
MGEGAAGEFGEDGRGIVAFVFMVRRDARPTRTPIGPGDG